jgi:predicted glycosyltransferase
MRHRAFVYVQHLLGIGHYVRARELARGLAEAGFDVHFVSGGMPVPGALPPGVRLVQLPPIRVTDASFAPLRDADARPIDDGYRVRRRERLLAAFDAAAPSAVLIESFPFGRRALAFELVPLLARIAAARPRPVVASSIRDILQRHRKPGRDRDVLDTLAGGFDAVLVHGDARFIRLDATFPPAAEIVPPVHYTGFVTAAPATPMAPRERNEIVVSAGGGAVGVEMLDAALAARKHSRFGHLTWRVLAGPNLAEADLARLLHAAGPRTLVEVARVDLRHALAGALVSVSQAGYNTVLDVAASGARAVLVPFADQGETEQPMRAARLAELDLAVVVDAQRIDAATLARAIDAAATRDRWGRFDFDCDGAAATARIIGALVRGAASAKRATA